MTFKRNFNIHIVYCPLITLLLPSYTEVGKQFGMKIEILTPLLLVKNHLNMLCFQRVHHNHNYILCVAMVNSSTKQPTKRFMLGQEVSLYELSSFLSLNG